VDKYKIDIVPCEESPLFYSTQNTERDLEIGCIGHLRADFGNSGNEFWSTWEEHCSELKTQVFQDEFQDLINRLCAADLLKDRTSMSDYCFNNPKAKIIDGQEENYGFKIKTENYVYYLRCFPLKGDYNLYCYAYERNRLEKVYPPLDDNVMEENHHKNILEGIRKEICSDIDKAVKSTKSLTKAFDKLFKKYGKDLYGIANYDKNDAFMDINYKCVCFTIWLDCDKQELRLTSDVEYYEQNENGKDIYSAPKSKEWGEYSVKESELIRTVKKPSLLARVEEGKQKVALQKSKKQNLNTDKKKDTTEL